MKLSVLGAGRMKLSVLGAGRIKLSVLVTFWDHHSKKLSIFGHFLINFDQNMSLFAKNVLFKFRMSFFTRISIETA